MPNASPCRIIDTFPRFLAFWKSSRSLPLDRQIEAWARGYLGPYPELLAKQVRDYKSQGLDWRQIAADRVFPHFPHRLDRMRHARRNLLILADPVWRQVQQALGFRLSVQFVIYAGIGCGAGWATKYDGRPAVLLGLENIAEEGWWDRTSLRSLLTHELAHLFLAHIRGKHHRPLGRGPYWQLYDEGFASFCEHGIRSPGTPHRVRRPFSCTTEPPDPSVLGPLAARFLQAAEARQPVSAFFGSWLEVEGQSMTGYVLGEHILSRLAQRSGMAGCALIPQVNQTMRQELARIASRGV